MLTNYHTHTTYCDGKSTVEEIVLSAISHGFDAIGFSGHGYTPFDLSYCMKDTAGYLAEVRRVAEKYKKDIEVYAGVEEDAFAPVKREGFDYIIGSSHYFLIGGRYYPIDWEPDTVRECIDLCDGDAVRLAEDYYSAFCRYLNTYHPHIIGHFDLLTKFDEQAPIFLNNADYRRIACHYVMEAAKSGGIFEINTGAISRGYRTAPYPHEELLYLLKRENAKVMLSSDSHSAHTLDFGFDDARRLLREVGFTSVTVLHRGEFVSQPL